MSHCAVFWGLQSFDVSGVLPAPSDAVADNLVPTAGLCPQ